MGLTVLVTGAAGQVGSELLRAFAGHRVLGTTVDVAEREEVDAAVLSVRPDRIVHAAAWTDVDGCEGDVDRAFRTNALGTRHVVEAARRVGAHVVYLSTDYVFDGESDRPYAEWDEPRPPSVYGRSKLAGERELHPGDTVVRTSWVAGRHGRNFVKTMLRLAGEGQDPVPVVADQLGSPTMAADLAAGVARLTVEARPGVYHVTNQGTATWYELACAVFEAAGQNPGRVKAIATADLDPPRPAPRPRMSVLDNAALRLSGLPLLPDFRPSLQALVRELRG
ncbi:MAG TPA: dTDP-4-dehydrorhamnose reductase [Acidimicrobiales bacterium]|nr:dTDP-4-dehydrorhamnose reductase [Acidimicrobiales bacterium]